MQDKLHILQTDLISDPLQNLVICSRLKKNCLIKFKEPNFILFKIVIFHYSKVRGLFFFKKMQRSVVLYINYFFLLCFKYFLAAVNDLLPHFA